jgi:3-methylcrotonyl-CoA carboxylase alpha subunit
MFERLGDWRLNLPARRYVELWRPDGSKVALTITGAVIEGLTLDQDCHPRESGDPRTRTLEVMGPRFRGDDRIEEKGSSAATGHFTGDVTFAADLAGRHVEAVVVRDDDTVEVRIAGVAARLSLRAQRAASTEPGGDGRVIAPMPGRVLALDVSIGAQVAVGERLLVLEAMKMEHRLVAKVAGVVTAVHVAEGDQVGDGTVLVEIEAG